MPKTKKWRPREPAPQPEPAVLEVEPAQPEGGMFDRIMAQLGPSWGRFAESLRALDCKPRMAQLEIDGLVYTSVKWPTSIGLDLKARGVEVLGPGVAAALATGEDLSSLGIEVIVGIARAAAKAGVASLMRDTLSRMSCNRLHTTGKAGEVLDDFEEHFSGEDQHLLRVCLFAWVHNLRGFTLGAR